MRKWIDHADESSDYSFSSTDSVYGLRMDANCGRVHFISLKIVIRFKLMGLDVAIHNYINITCFVVTQRTYTEPV